MIISVMLFPFPKGVQMIVSMSCIDTSPTGIKPIELTLVGKYPLVIEVMTMFTALKPMKFMQIKHVLTNFYFK